MCVLHCCSAWPCCVLLYVLGQGSGPPVADTEVIGVTESLLPRPRAQGSVRPSLSGGPSGCSGIAHLSRRVPEHAICESVDSSIWQAAASHSTVICRCPSEGLQALLPWLPYVVPESFGAQLPYPPLQQPLADEACLHGRAYGRQCTLRDHSRHPSHAHVLVHHTQSSRCRPHA